MAEEDFVERTLAQLPSCHAFRIPPRRSAEGHRASEWSDKVWQGRLRIVQKGKEAAIILNDADNNVFAVCPIKEGSVEKVVDSSRYFVLRIENAQGRHAFIGLAFNDRNDAFDFNVALHEYQKDLEREKTLAEGGDLLQTGPSKDYSLKAGEKISISIKGASEGAKRDKKSSSGGLAPPPRDTPSRRPPRQGTDLVGSGSFSAPPTQADAFSPTTTSAPRAVSNDFGGADFFDSPTPISPTASSAFSSQNASAFGSFTASSGSSTGSGFGGGDPFGMGAMGAALPQQQRSPVDPFGGFPSSGFGAAPSSHAAAPAAAAADPFALDMFGSASQPVRSQQPRTADPFDLLS